MVASLLVELKVFLFIMSLFVVFADTLYAIAVWRLKNGKIISSTKSLVVFGVALAYIITRIIFGF